MLHGLSAAVAGSTGSAKAKAATQKMPFFKKTLARSDKGKKQIKVSMERVIKKHEKNGWIMRDSGGYLLEKGLKS